LISILSILAYTLSSCEHFLHACYELLLWTFPSVKLCTPVHRHVKGTVAWDFYPLVLFINWSHLGPCLLHSIIFKFYFEFADLFEFEIRTALWATAGNQIFFADTRDLKLVWHRPFQVLFIYTRFLSSLFL
jgi:hypothetical protein